MDLNTNKSLKINIDNYSGPLDVLLDLAKTQKVDLEDISITQLADQFIEFINSTKSKYVLSLYELLKSYSNYIMKKNFLSINIPKLPICTTEQAIGIIKKNIKHLNDWKEIYALIPDKFKKTKKLKKSGVAGFFSASLELTREGLINIMQKKSFDKLFIKGRK